jgi:hypothetical protein
VRLDAVTVTFPGGNARPISPPPGIYVWKRSHHMDIAWVAFWQKPGSNQSISFKKRIKYRKRFFFPYDKFQSDKWTNKLSVCTQHAAVKHTFTRKLFSLEVAYVKAHHGHFVQRRFVSRQDRQKMTTMKFVERKINIFIEFNLMCVLISHVWQEGSQI